MRLFLIFLLPLFIYSAVEAYAPGEQWAFFFWKRDQGQTENHGVYCATRVQHTYLNNNGALYELEAHVEMPNWANLVIDNRAEVQLTVANTRPQKVVSNSVLFDTAEWVEKLTVTLADTSYECTFLFPALSDEPYPQHSHFTVAVNDSIDLQFSALEEGVFVGTLFNTARLNTPESWIMGRNAMIIRTNKNYPLGISSVEINGAYRSLLKQYLGVDLSTFDSDAVAYGFDLVDTTLTLPPSSMTTTVLYDTAKSEIMVSDTAVSESVISDTTYTNTTIGNTTITDSIISDRVIKTTTITDTISVNTTITKVAITYDGTTYDTVTTEMTYTDMQIVRKVLEDHTIPIDYGEVSISRKESVLPSEMNFKNIAYNKNSFLLNFALPEAGHYVIHLAVYTPQGKLVYDSQTQSFLTSGFHSLSLHKDLANGLYFIHANIQGNGKRARISKSATVVR